MVILTLFHSDRGVVVIELSLSLYTDNSTVVLH